MINKNKKNKKIYINKLKTMALTYSSAIAALLNNGKDQVLPISMANLIELAANKEKFGTGAQSVQDALGYLATSFEHANNVAKTAQDNAFAYVGQEINKLDVDKVGSLTSTGHDKFISYIYQEDGKIKAFAQDMSAANVAYAGGLDGRVTVADELKHINATIADNLTATKLKLVKTGSGGADEVVETVSADGTEYRLKQGEEVVAKFNIEKDSFVKSGSVVHGTLVGTKFTEGTPDAPGKYYIKLEIKTHDAATDSAAESTLYIPAESLVDAYSAKNDGNNVTIAVDQDKNTISAKINAGGVGTTELADSAVTAAKIATSAVETDKIAALAVTAEKIAASAITTEKINASAVTTDKIADKNVTKVKLADDVQTSLGKADSAVQKITEGSIAGAINVDGAAVHVHGLANVATTGAAANVSVVTIAELDAIAGYDSTTHVDDVQEALEKLAVKVNAINDGGVVTSVKASVVDTGKDTQNAVTISMTPVAESKGAVEVQLTHNLGSAAALDYDMKTVATPVSEDFWKSVQ